MNIKDQMYHHRLVPHVSENYSLDLLKLSDVNERYVSWLNDIRINRFMEFRFDKHTLESQRKYVANTELDETKINFAIKDPSTFEIIGIVGLESVDIRHKTAFISIFIGETTAQGLGIATSVLQYLTDSVLKSLILLRIEAGVYAENENSLKLFRRCGFELEGVKKSARQLDEGTRCDLHLFAKTV